MEKDDGVRSDFGLIACLRKMNDGTTKLILDDVRAKTDKNPISWKFENMFTFNRYNSDKLERLDISEKEFASIGENLVIRLLALNGDLKK
jgi:hypothetical protein